MTYTKPQVVDLGDLVKITAATTLYGTEGLGSKRAAPLYHSMPISP